MSSLGLLRPSLRESTKEGSDVFEFLKDDLNVGNFSNGFGFY
jgi:hypothetical protein